MPPEVQVNRPGDFVIVVRNTGRVPAYEVKVFDEVPKGTRFISADPAPTSNNSGQLIWELKTLNPGQERSIKMKLMPLQAGEIGSVAHVAFSAKASGKTVCTQPKLEISAEGPGEVLIGDDVIINIQVTNVGTGNAENVLLQEDVPDALDFVNGLRQLEYPVGMLRPGEQRKVQLRLKAARIGSARNLLVAHGEGNLTAQDTPITVAN